MKRLLQTAARALRLRKRPRRDAPDLWQVLSAVVAENPRPVPDRAVAALSQLQELAPAADPYLERALRLTALHRCVVLQERLLAECGPVVQAGPFAGMVLADGTAEGCYVPKLLGCYEAALHDEVERVVAAGYPTIVNIGCADGFYAVGLARRMPNTRVLAYDISREARESCQTLAHRNGVADRVEVRGEFRGEDFASLGGGPTLVLCDIEGGERDVLLPARHPRLHSLDLIVELHGIASHGTEATLRDRFAASHGIRTLHARHPAWPLPASLSGADELDQLLAVWEWRTEPTPWMILRAKEPSPVEGGPA